MTLPATIFGVTLSCRDGFDELFSVAQTDEQIVLDDVYHRMTTDTVLGDTEEAASFGLNVFRRCGAAMSDPQIAALGPEYAAMLQGSPLVEFADVAVTRGTRTDLIGLNFEVSVTAKSPLTGDIVGSFSFVFRLTGDTFFRVGDPDAVGA
jgi:hypothetical protein